MAILATTSPTATAPAPKNFLRILYADDLRELRELARLSFSRDGHGIECLPDGLTALNRIMADPNFDLVITDHHMPQMNGLEFVKGLRKLGFPGKIMVFSSELSPEVAREYRELHVDRILYKPIFPSALRQAMSELFNLPNRVQR